MSTAGTHTLDWSKIDALVATGLKAPPAIAMTWSAPHKQFKKTLGTYLHKDGKPRPRVFWLGRDYTAAHMKLQALNTQWQLRNMLGFEHWTPEREQHAMQLYEMQVQLVNSAKRAVRDADMNLLRAINHAGGNPAPSHDDVAVLTVAATPVVQQHQANMLSWAITQYSDLLSTRVPFRLSEKNYKRQVESLKLIGEVLDTAMPLSRITGVEMEKLVNYFASRPVREKTGRPMAPATVTTVVGNFRLLFDWLDGKFGWVAPRRMDKIFRVSRTKLMTHAEQRASADGQDTFTLPELKAHYAHSTNDRQRLYILLGLNCGFTQKDIATLLLDDVVVDEVTTVIDRYRTKTRGAGVKGRWVLWPETAQLLAREMAKTPISAKDNPQRLALLSEDGRMLVDDSTDTDSIAQSWVRLGRRVKAVEANNDVRALPFKVLRKTGSDAVLRLSNEAVQQLYLAHKGRSVAARHYTGQTDFQPLVIPLERMREQLKTAGVF